MFERNFAPTQDIGAISVEITLDDGTVQNGRLLIPASRTVFDILNGPSAFLEFEPYKGERRYVSKSALKAVRLMAGAKPVSLTQKLRDLDGFDPFAILGVTADTEWNSVRAAYLAATKSYHPDRYASADLPSEVTAYLSGMLRRINAAYAALTAVNDAKKQAAERRQEAFYVNCARV
jgi:cation transport regulator ChaB